MPATIKIKNSSTASAVPTSSDLVQGELAVNVTDKRIFTENASGTVVELGTNPTILTMGASGSASAPVITRTGDTNTGIFFPAADTIAFAEGGVEAMRLDSAGNLGLGVTPSAWVTLKGLEIAGLGNSVAGYPADAGMYVSSNAYYGTGGWRYGYSSKLATLYSAEAGVHKWSTAGSGTAGNAITFTQAMTLDASGNLLVGKTSTSFTTVGVEARAGGIIASTMPGSDNSTVSYYLYSTGASAYRFYVGLGGTIYATSATISALSDQRFKENIRDLDNGLATVMSLKPRKFDWKEGKGKDIKNDLGFIAQEFEQVLPEMVETWRDSAPEGEEPYKAVNANLIPTLVKAIQELNAKVDAQAAEIAALKG